MSIKMKDVKFVKCQEYSPYSSKADALGIKIFWRADILVGPFTYSIAYGDTKAECRQEASAYLKRNPTGEPK